MLVQRLSEGLGCKHVVVCGQGVNDSRDAATYLDHVGVAGPIGRGDDDFVAGTDH